jgi:hypothetical protein
MSRFLRVSSGRWLAPLLAVGLCAGGALFWWSLLAPAAARVERLRLTAVQPPAVRAMRAALRARPAPRLAPETAFPDALGQLAQAAQAAGLAFDEGNYRIARLAQGRQVLYAIDMPLHGTYPQMRAFLAAAAVALPALAVEHIRLQRNKVSDPVLEARVRMVLPMESVS